MTNILYFESRVGFYSIPETEVEILTLKGGSGGTVSYEVARIVQDKEETQEELWLSVAQMAGYNDSDPVKKLIDKLSEKFQIKRK